MFVSGKRKRCPALSLIARRIFADASRVPKKGRKMITIEKALKINGWMDPPELKWLAEQATTHTRIAEVGSWQGRSTRALADNTSGIVYAVDTWEGTAAPGLQEEVHKKLLEGKPAEFLMDTFNANMAGLDNVCALRKTSLEAASGWGSSPLFDMIFIDASHDYVNVKADILAWRPLLVPGGLFCGHDYDPQHWPEVIKAVDELFPNRKNAPGSIWYAV
jgi:predicted O-methyltransferase YrrM